MEARNFFNEASHLLTVLSVHGLKYDAVEKTDRTKRYWIEPCDDDVTMDEAEAMVRRICDIEATHDFGVGRLPEGPVELEIHRDLR